MTAELAIDRRRSGSRRIADVWPELTVREFAEQERVTERTVRRWIAKGAVAVRKTSGGGIRIYDRRNEPREPDKGGQRMTS